MPVDLHLHTNKSDGSLSPAEVVQNAANAKLSAIAISDHDMTEGIDEAVTAGSTLGIVVIPAVEFSSKYNSRDVHILGYFIAHKNPELQEYLKVLKDARLERAAKIVKCLQDIGLDITFEEVLEQAGTSAVGRPHIARFMLKHGYISEFSEAFEKYLKRGMPCYIEKFVYPPDELISLIHRLGGVAVIAHPGLGGLDEFIPDLVKMGLDGFEAYHTDHGPEATKRYLEYAKKYGLIVTGGSDCHGPVSKHGLRIGTVQVPDEVVDALRTRALQYLP